MREKEEVGRLERKEKRGAKRDCQLNEELVVSSSPNQSFLTLLSIYIIIHISSFHPLRLSLFLRLPNASKTPKILPDHSPIFNHNLNSR